MISLCIDGINTLLLTCIGLHWQAIGTHLKALLRGGPGGGVHRLLWVDPRRDLPPQPEDILTYLLLGEQKIGNDFFELFLEGL